MLHFCQGEWDRVRGAPQAALVTLEQALALIGGPRKHQIWANVAAAHVRVLNELGRHEEAIDRGTEYLSAAEVHGLGYLAHYIRIPLSHALCQSDPSAATSLADLAVAGFRALGSKGLNMVLALENRAQLALEAEGPAAFERYAVLSSAEHEGLSKRLRRTLRTGRLQGAGAELGAGRTAANELARAIKSVLQTGSEDSEVMQRAIALLANHASARGGVLYRRQNEELQRMAWGGEVLHLSELDEWARLYVAKQIFAQQASTSLLDQMEDEDPPAHGVPAGMYVPHMLGHEEAADFVYTGLLVLVMPMGSYFTWLDSATDPLSRAIIGFA